jgi:hypothetical protein
LAARLRQRGRSWKATRQLVDGDNVLEFALRDLRALVGPSRTLRVVGDALDQLEVDVMGAGFMDLGSSGGVHTWSNGVFTLEVNSAFDRVFRRAIDAGHAAEDFAMLHTLMRPARAG